MVVLLHRHDSFGDSRSAYYDCLPFIIPLVMEDDKSMCVCVCVAKGERKSEAYLCMCFTIACGGGGGEISLLPQMPHHGS